LRIFLSSTKSDCLLYCISVHISDCFGFRLFFDAITFSGVGGVRNLSRSDPAKLSTGFGSQTYFHATGGSGPLTFVSAVRVGECHLIEPKSNSNGKIQRLIEGAVIEGEWDRLVAVIGHVINQVEYKAQVQAGYVSFATALTSPDHGELLDLYRAIIMLIVKQLLRLPPIHAISDVLVVLILLPGVPAPAVQRSWPMTLVRSLLLFDAILHLNSISAVPIYDARKLKFEKSFYELVLEVDQLPRISRELPVDSCAVVAYTVNTWGTPINVSFNIKWAMLLGIPGGRI
jgi:hypothetical protein